MKKGYRLLGKLYGQQWLKSTKGVKVTRRQHDVLRLICLQQTDKQIGERLGKSTRTVETHRAKLIKQIGAKNVAGLVLYAIANKIVTV